MTATSMTDWYNCPLETSVSTAATPGVAAVTAFLEELDADPARVRRLCGWEWITTAIIALPESLDNAA